MESMQLVSLISCSDKTVTARKDDAPAAAGLIESLVMIRALAVVAPLPAVP